ncbi:MAG: TIGR02391 family protein [Anaerolinea sp.]|nr:TIGR02391 family protein [Anaerolinea sp.]
MDGEMKIGEFISVILTKKELDFLNWCMRFIEGGPFGVDEENQRKTFELKISQLLQKIKEGYLTLTDRDSSFIECAFCEGDGVYPSELYIEDEFPNFPCPVCHGKGLNKINLNNKNIIKCRFCDGIGRAWDSDGRATGEVCEVCLGTGFVNLEDDTDETEKDPFWSLIHPRILKVSKSRFISKHYSDSVEAAFKEINSIIKIIVRDEIGEELDGAALMNKAFSLSQPIIKLGDVSTETGKNLQQGYLQIFAGSMTGIRNPKAHGNENITNNIAMQQLSLASLLMFTLDNRL